MASFTVEQIEIRQEQGYAELTEMKVFGIVAIGSGKFEAEFALTDDEIQSLGFVLKQIEDRILKELRE